MDVFLCIFTYRKKLVMNVMSHIVDEMAELLGKGYSVSIEGLGSFRASIGLEKDKEMDTFDEDDTKRIVL